MKKSPPKKTVTRTSLASFQRNVLEQLSEIRNTLENIVNQNYREAKRIKDMSKTTKDVLAAVAKESTVLDSVAVFIQELKDKAAQQGVEQADIEAIFAGVEANTAKAALFQNTPTPEPV